MSNPHKPNFEQDFIDYPTGFWLQEHRPAWDEHDPKCSARLRQGGFLCDCDWLELEWNNYRRPANDPQGEGV